MEKLTYTTEEAAEALGVSRVTFYKLMKREKHPIPAVYIGSGKKPRRLISRAALEKWIAEETEMTMKGRG